MMVNFNLIFNIVIHFKNLLIDFIVLDKYDDNYLFLYLYIVVFYIKQNV